jgi:hypothetical protein
MSQKINNVDLNSPAFYIYSGVKANTHITTILPIALAVLLPGLSIYSNPGNGILEGGSFFFAWPISSLFLYALWRLFWAIWDLPSQYRVWGFLAAMLAFLGILAGVFLLIGFENTTGSPGVGVVRYILASVLFLAIQFAMKAQQHVSTLSLEKEQMQTENYKVQLKALRAKIDPHFLFNSLNTLRSMVRQQHGNAEKFVMSLSDFYRQTLQHNENTMLVLSDELTVLESYLFLMKSRHGEAVSIDLNIDKDLFQYHIPTLALQVVVENCFKHNSLTSKKPLHIEINNTAGFYIEVKNNIQPKLGEQGSSGFGLELLRKRYELINVQEGLIVEQTPEQFIVKLKLV